jgi:aryl-alcohol dehydrogenase-like predicted oxidoreductase
MHSSPAHTARAVLQNRREAPRYNLLMQRREFLQASLGAALAVKGVAAASATGEARNRQPGMAYRRLGRTGFLVSEIVMGGNTIVAERQDHVLMAIDMGLNYLDTAPAYGKGRSEQGFAEVIKARGREKLFLTTKVSLWDLNRNRLFREIFDSLDEAEQKRLRAAAGEEIARRQADAPDYFVGYFQGQRGEIDDAALSNVMESRYGRRIDRRKNHRQLVLDSVDESLGRLRTDYVDLLMCPHGANTPYELLNFPEVFDAFETLKKAGKVRHLGVSAHSDPAGILEAAVKAKVYSAAMVAYNFVNGPWVEKALEAAARADFGVIAMKVARPVVGRGENVPPPERLARLDAAVRGDLKPPQKAYAWALRNPNLAACVSDMNTREHVSDNLPLGAPKPA